MPKKTKKTTAVREYAAGRPETNTPRKRVRVLTDKIERARGLLRFDSRMAGALNAQAMVRNERPLPKSMPRGLPKANYMLPALESRSRTSLPDIPTPHVEARDPKGEPYEDTVRRLLDMAMRGPSSVTADTCRMLNYDDAYAGVAIGKVVWRVTSSIPSDTMTQDIDSIAADIEEASLENADPVAARVEDNDLDHVHLQIHSEALGSLEQDSAEYTSLLNHIREHEARVVEIVQEKPELVRVDPFLFTYDPDVPWQRRSWEAETRSLRVEELRALGYKNLNYKNCPPETKEGEGVLPYEDATVRIHEFHDKNTDELFVFSADNGDSEPLYEGPWPYQGMDIYFRLVLRPFAPDEAFGIATAAMMVPIAERLQEVDFWIDTHGRNHAASRWALPKNATNDDKANLKDPNRQFVGLTDNSLALAKLLETPPIPSPLLDLRNLLLAEFVRIAGAEHQDMGAEYSQQITATESQRRSLSSDLSAEQRQETWSGFLTSVAMGFLAMYRRFGTKQRLSVRTIDEMGQAYDRLLPSDIPDGIEAYLDVSSMSPAKAQQGVNNMVSLIDTMLKTAYPMDATKTVEGLARRMGITRPEQFRLQQAIQQAAPEGAGPAQPQTASQQPPGGLRVLSA